MGNKNYLTLLEAIVVDIVVVVVNVLGVAILDVADPIIISCDQ